jgi:hypothetical protein
MLKHGENYVEQGVQYYEEKYQAKVLASLQKKANSLSFTLTKNVAA